MAVLFFLATNANWPKTEAYRRLVGCCVLRDIRFSRVTFSMLCWGRKKKYREENFMMQKIWRFSFLFFSWNKYIKVAKNKLCFEKKGYWILSSFEMQRCGKDDSFDAAVRLNNLCRRFFHLKRTLFHLLFFIIKKFLATGKLQRSYFQCCSAIKIRQACLVGVFPPYQIYFINFLIML